MAINSPLSTRNGVINITSGTGAINIGTDAAEKTITLGNNTGASGVILQAGTAGVSIASFSTTGAVVSNASGVLSDADAATAGFVLTSNGTGSAPSFQAAAGGGISWNVVTGTSDTMEAGNGYITNNASLVVLTLPATSSVGDQISVQGYGAGKWRVSQGAGQQIRVGNVSTTVGATGYVLAADQYDAATFVCVVANTEWLCMSVLSSGLDLL